MARNCGECSKGQRFKNNPNSNVIVCTDEENFMVEKTFLSTLRKPEDTCNNFMEKIF